MSTERARKSAYAWVARAIDARVIQVVDPLSAEALAEVFRIRDAMKAVSEVELSPSALIDLSSGAGESAAAPPPAGVPSLAGAVESSRGGEGQEPAAALEGAPPPASDSPAAPLPSDGGCWLPGCRCSRCLEIERRERAVTAVTCDDAVRWLNQGLPEGVVGATLFRFHILNDGRCGDAAASRALSDAARLG